MIKDVVENAVWTKAQALILDKYGKKIAFKTIDLSNSAASFFLEGDDLIIPLNSRSVQLGEVIVNRGSLLSQEQKGEVVDLVKFLIEPHVYNKHLKLKEEIEAFKRSQVASSGENVYSLFDDGDEDASLVKLISTVIHLKSGSELKRKKVALKIHEMAEQNLFIAFSEVSKQIHSVEEFSSFEKTTFYIEDLATLNDHELSLLSAACEKKFDLVFIIGSNLSTPEVDALTVSSNLKNDLNAILFDIDRVPLSQQTSTDVLELLFFSIDQFHGS